MFGSTFRPKCNQTQAHSSGLFSLAFLVVWSMNMTQNLQEMNFVHQKQGGQMWFLGWSNQLAQFIQVSDNPTHSSSQFVHVSVILIQLAYVNAILIQLDWQGKYHFDSVRPARSKCSACSMGALAGQVHIIFVSFLMRVWFVLIILFLYQLPILDTETPTILVSIGQSRYRVSKNFIRYVHFRVTISK